MSANNARSHDSRPIVALDWSLRGVHVTLDGEAVTFYASVEELLEVLEVPHQICAEATFESWDPERRVRLVELIRSQGHEIYVYRPIHTARARGTAIAKSDANDARVIYDIANKGHLHLYPILDLDAEWAAYRAECNAEYQHLRLSGLKPELSAAAMAILGPYRELGAEAQLVLGNGREYSKTLLAATYFAAGRVRSRAMFERLLGLHGSAHPSLLRSDVHHHCFRHARARGATWNAYRRVLRHTYAAYRAAGVAPEYDTST